MKSNSLTPNADSLAALSPDRLAAEAAQAVHELLAEAAAANTTRSYAAALRYWAAWFQGRFGRPITLPVPEPAVVQFVVDHLARRGKDGLAWELPAALDAHLVAGGLKQRPGAFKLNTVVHRVAVLSSAHQAHKADNPCASPAVRQLLARGRRAAVKRRDRPTKKTAITKPEIDALVATCDDSLEGLRDRALLFFGFASGGRRRSEIAAADCRTCAASARPSSSTASSTARPSRPASRLAPRRQAGLGAGWRRARRPGCPLQRSPKVPSSAACGARASDRRCQTSSVATIVQRRAQHSRA